MKLKSYLIILTILAGIGIVLFGSYFFQQTALPPEEGAENKTPADAGAAISYNESALNISIDPEIYEQFKNNTWIVVIIRLHDESNLTLNPSDPLEVRLQVDQQRKAYFARKTEEVIKTLSPSEYKYQYDLTGGFSANITQSGFEKLAKSPHVRKIKFSEGQTSLANTYDNRE